MLENREKFDLKYEEYQKNLNVNDGIVLDSRLGFYCQPKAFKVYLDVTDEEAARRIFGDKERVGDHYDSLQAVQAATEKRNQDDIKRYKKLYNIDLSDRANFDLVVDTTGKFPQQVADEIIQVFNEYKK
ncbi:MAG: (d)CMP kinase [bacterium]